MHSNTIYFGHKVSNQIETTWGSGNICQYLLWVSLEYGASSLQLATLSGEGAVLFCGSRLGP